MSPALLKYALGGVAALAVAGSLWAGVAWLRADARADLLRELEIQQMERTTNDKREQDRLRQEIESLTPDELRRRACAGGMLDEASCAAD